MASTFAGGQQAPSVPPSMLGFGPAAAAPFFGPSDPNQRLQQYYSSHQQQQAPSGVSKDFSGRRCGKVKFFDTQKGFGFINDYRPEELGNEEVFVHYTSITAKSGFRSLAEGEEAEYELVRGAKGFQAANVSGPGGQQVIGDSRSRVPKPAFMNMSPYTAMYPYMQQDPASFYGASPYQQPVLLMPPGDYRSPPAHAQALYRHSPHFPGAPSPYNSPGPLRPFDIGRDFGSMSLGVANVDEGGRSRSAQQQAPFGGMFGALPGFSASTSLPPSTSSQPHASHHHKAVPSVPSGIVSGRSNSLSNSDNAAVPTRSERDADSTQVHHPSSIHSRSSSLLYGSASKSVDNPVAPN